MAEPLLRVNDLSTYLRVGEREVAAVDGVSFSLEAGGSLGLVGESGSGKSLTALSLMRLFPARLGRIAGDIFLEGENLLALPEAAMRARRGARLAMVFQEPMTALNPVLTIGTQVIEALVAHQDLSAPARRQRALELLDQVGISEASERLKSYPHTLSGGMRQRVLIAMAIAAHPRLLIADEPTTALDLSLQAQVMTLLQKLQRDTGMALLLISHDLGRIRESCREVGVMYAGRIVERGPTERLFAAPAHPYTAGLLRVTASLSAGGQGRLATLDGAAPALTERPSGCRFRKRCERAQAEWAALEPLLREHRPGTLAACHHPVPVP